MKFKVSMGIVLTVLLVSMLTLAFNVQPVESEPATWTVDDDGPADFSSIQEAINAASQGDTIYVYNGTYHEQVAVNKSVSLIGENKYNTIIDGSGVETVVPIIASNITLRGFTIQNGGDGIYTDLSDNHNISYNIITNNSRGINAYVVYSGISNNDIFSNEVGIVLTGWSMGNTISDNNVSNNEVGIRLSNFGSNIFRNNNINNNTYNFGVYPFFPLTPPYYIYDIDTSNTVDGKPIYWWVNQQNKQIPSDAGYVAVVSSRNITVKDLNLTKNLQGVFFANTTNSIITNVSVSNNYEGIMLAYSHNNMILHNNFINNTNQAYVHYSSNNVWDDGYPSGGNYWSDYTGVDVKSGSNQDCLGSDGIGDIPYTINVNDTDRYPLMEPFPCEITPVGGIYVTIDKLSLLAPYIALASTIILAVSMSVAYIKYRKKQ